MAISFKFSRKSAIFPILLYISVFLSLFPKQLEAYRNHQSDVICNSKSGFTKQDQRGIQNKDIRKFSNIMGLMKRPTTNKLSYSLMNPADIDISSILSIRSGAIINDIMISPARDALVSVIVVAESLLWLKVWTAAAKKKILPSVITRKIIHAGSAPLFMLHWPLYSNVPVEGLSSFLSWPVICASSVPLLQIIRLYLAGSSNRLSNLQSENAGSNNEVSELVAAVSRSGEKREALGGPLIYSIVLFLATLLLFRNSPEGVVAVSQMAMGDGLADIFGRRWGTKKWPFSSSKSIVGSLAFVLGGALCSFGVLYWLHFNGFMPSLDVIGNIRSILLISLLSAIVELVPGVDDNISVPIVAAIATHFLLVLN